MRRGVWHQCGDRSQKLALEQINAGNGVGVIVSPRDLAFDNAKRYTAEYIGAGASVLLDLQFYTPESTSGHLESYPTATHRQTVSDLHGLSTVELADLSARIDQTSRELQVSGIIAPGVVIEAGRPEISRLNTKLFHAAKQVGDALGLPVYATVVLGRSATATSATINAALASATAVAADGWYYAFEFEPARLPASKESVFQCCAAGLTLACTGKPVLHAYAGPLGLLSLGFGATGVGIGHSQNLWKFDRSRWDEITIGGGGGGAAPARYFSRALWGTIIHPDETAQLDTSTKATVLTPSPFTVPWDRWTSGKHLVYVVGLGITEVGVSLNARSCSAAAIRVLDDAITNHDKIAGMGVTLADVTNGYQASWRAAATDLLRDRAADFDYLDLLL